MAERKSDFAQGAVIIAIQRNAGNRIEPMFEEIANDLRSFATGSKSPKSGNVDVWWSAGAFGGLTNSTDYEGLLTAAIRELSFALDSHREQAVINQRCKHWHIPPSKIISTFVPYGHSVSDAVCRARVWRSIIKDVDPRQDPRGALEGYLFYDARSPTHYVLRPDGENITAIDIWPGSIVDLQQPDGSWLPLT